MKPDRFILDHLPKTAGTSLFAAFSEIHGSSAVNQVPNGTSAVRAERSLKGDVRLAGGHLAFRPGHTIPPAIGYLTFLRDPVDRALSIYFHARHLAPAAPGTYVEFAKSLDLESFVDCDEPVVREEISNYYTRHFSLTRRKTSAKPAEAKARLSDYFFVGLFESFEESVLVLCGLAHWNPPKSFPALNVSRHTRTAISPQVRAKLEQINQDDLAVYQHAKEIFAGMHRRVLRTIVMAPEKHREESREPVRPNEDSNGKTMETITHAPQVDFGSGKIRIVDVQTIKDTQPKTTFSSGDIMRVRVRLFSSITAHDIAVGLSIRDSDERVVFGTNLALMRQALSVEPNQEYRVEFKISLRLGAGDYRIGISIHSGTSHLDECFEWRDPAAVFTVAGFATVPFDGLVDLPCVASKTFERAHIPLSGFDAAIEVSPDPENGGFLVQAHNKGGEVWPHVGPIAVRAGCRWLDASKNIVEAEGPRSSFRSSVPPGSHATVGLQPGSPPAGSAYCRVTLVQEGVAWFDQMNGPFCDILVSDISESPSKLEVSS